MKLASFEVATPVGPRRRVGVLRPDESSLVDVTAATAARLGAQGEAEPTALAESVAPPDAISFLAAGDRAMDAAERALTFAAESDAAAGPDGAAVRYDVDDVTLLAPVPRPNSLRDFMTFEEHVSNARDGDVPDVWYDIPVYYKGNPDAVVRPGADVQWPSYTEKLDYELELAAVIGRECRDVDAGEAMDYVAGYTIFDDFSARDVQAREMAGGLGPAKGKDFANGLGPYLVTPDEVDLADLRVSARVNGEVWSEGDVGEMHHSFPEVIEYVSRDETLYPGDVLGSGTVGRGCGLELDRWLEPGDTIELRAEGIGTLTHRVVK